MKSKILLTHACFAIITGILPLIFLHELPTSVIWYCLALSATVLALINYSVSRLAALIIVSFLWATTVAQGMINLADQYPEANYNIIGSVVSLNINQPADKRISFLVQEIEGKQLSLVEQFTLSLSWQEDNLAISSGQLWHLVVSFRPLHSRLNEGGFDRQRWALANHSILSGTVRESRLLKSSVSFRQTIANLILSKIDQFTFADILIALILGERERIDQARNTVLRETGTAHLMAISGMHITLVAWFGWLIARGFQFFLPCHRIGVIFPYVSGWLLALVYVWISGANPPALRAVLALTIWLYLRYRGFLWTSWQVWLSIVTVLLLVDPLMVLSDSFWLSCCAVATLIFLYQWLPLPLAIQQSKRWFLIQWLHLQAGIMLLLMPLQILIFHGISISALISNLFAVPIVSFITLPTILVALLFNSPSFWWLANASLKILFILLDYLTESWLWMSSEVLLVSFSAWIVIIVWRCSLWRYHTPLGVIIFIVILVPKWGENNDRWRIDMLDIGHGLAIVIRQGNKAIIYDTANRWDTDSMANKEILPFLRWHNIQLEGIILSHQHSDHMGGLEELQQAFPQSWLRSSSSSLSGLTCLQGDSWQWQGLTFEVLWPPKSVEVAYNPDSCVVRVDDGQYSVLLTGDLEKEQEAEIIATNAYRHKLNVNILQVPHHGSNTSSSALFLRHVQPDMAFSSNSRFNPWRLPSHKIKRRYQELGIEWYSTADEGQISILFSPQQWKIQSFRQHIKPRWYHRGFGVK